MLQRPFSVIVLSLIFGGGCLSLSPDERQTLERIGRAGYSLEHPPAGFVPSANDRKAACLNALPGIGNFYLAVNGGGGVQWALGTGNLLLWPISPAWSICEGYADAKTMNQRALAAYCANHPNLCEEPDASNGRPPNNPAQPPPPPPPPDPDPPPKPLYKIVGIEPQNEGQYVVRAEVEDRSKTFEVINGIKRDVQNLVREDFASQHATVDPTDIRESLKYKTEEDGKIVVFTAWAFSVRPVEAGWNYDPVTRKGQVRLRVMGGMPASETKRWARENISAIVSEKNVVIDAGKAPPKGAKFRSLDENYSNGILVVEFEAIE